MEESTALIDKEPEINRRLKIFWLYKSHAIHLLEVGLKEQDYIVVPSVKGVPEGGFIHNIFYDPSRMGFGFVVAHKSFEIVPDGEQIPDAPAPLLVQHESVPICHHGQSAIETMDRQELVRMRDAINTRLFDMERQQV